MTTRKPSGFFSTLSLIAGLLTIPKSPSGLAGGFLWLPKLLAESWAPFTAIIGGIGAVVGMRREDRRSVWMGLLGLILGALYTLRITTLPDPFISAFGRNWKDKIPPQLKKHPYRLIQPNPNPFPFQKDVIIGNSADTKELLLCDIWQPPQGILPSHLAVIFLHGGAWQALDKDYLSRPLFYRLVARGHMILDLAYSLSPGADLDRMLSDVQQAILWLKKHASELEVDPEKIVLMGTSGGAHLALLAAYAPGHPAFQKYFPESDMTICGVISTCGISDMRDFFMEYGHNNPEQPEYSSQMRIEKQPRVYNRTWLDKFMTRSRTFPTYRHANMPGGAYLLPYLMGGTLKERPDAYRLASPLEHIGSHCPPTLLLHGADDFFVNITHSRRLYQALSRKGVKAVYYEFPDSVHGFDQYFGVSRRVAPAAQVATHAIECFLALMAA